MFSLKGRSILIYDIETDSLDIRNAKVKWFGAYSYMDNQYYEYDYNDAEKIHTLITRHKNLVSFNGNDFDLPILENNFGTKLYKNHVDLLVVCKQRLATMGIKVKDYKLRTIVEQLELDKEGKGEIDYKIFYKDLWSEEEIKEIKYYLKQDIIITKALFEYFNSIFQSTVTMLSAEDNEKLMHIKASPASLSYRAILNNAGVKYEFANIDSKEEKQTFEGGHHIEPRLGKVKGNIVSVDFASMYPHMVIMFNLLSPKENGWCGDQYIKTTGKYNNEVQGKIEQSLNQILLDRLDAKKNKNKPKNLGYKILINSFYGTLGNSCFKTTYNPTSAGDCTRLARTILKQLAKTLEEHKFKVLYGFTDSVMVEIPHNETKEKLIETTNLFIKNILSFVPFPKETFKLEIDKELKFIVFFAKNCYLYVDNKDKIDYTSTLLNKNTPKIIMKLFNDYMSPKIISELDCNFTENEIKEKLIEYLKINPEHAGEDFNSKPISEYKVESSLEYQISSKYGTGKHCLIPNLSNIGVGKAKGTKKRNGIRYCTFEEFKKMNLSIEDIDIERLVKYLKPFCKKDIKEIEKQATLLS